MCAGKTTVGKALAKSMGLRFYDLDWYIEDRFHKRIADIFAEKGEEGFRDIEYRLLREAGITLFLKADPETIITHYHISHTVRPLLAGKNDEELKTFITQQLQNRSPFYEQAQYTIDVNVLDSYDKISIIVSQIQQILNLENGKMEN